MLFVLAGYICTSMAVADCQPVAVGTLFATEEACSDALQTIKQEAEKRHLVGSAACTAVKLPGRDA